ncbi:MAG: hypothetical protein OHK93_001479 [Ramalina farinacea]|uniref:SCP2 domain-containing protein n=1 Tax=Ramalina farinacea TaxID=258253 RepID=A0AA43QRN3_9LECA|nr:hypothetical protein [Ramalina farinacea]
MHRSTLKPLRFARLRGLVVNNTIADACQIARFIARHHRAVRHTKKMKLFFDDTVLRSGTWEEALEPLTQMSGSDSWKSSSEDSAVEATEEYMDVPLILNPADAIQEQQNKIWDDHVRLRSSNPCHSGMSNLQRAGRRTKEILFGTEDHMRKLLTSFPSSSAFDQIHSSLQSDPAERKDAVKKGNAIFSFNLKNNAGETESWFIDLKKEGKVGKGEFPEGEKADITLSLSDDDFGKMVAGKTQAQRLFMSGKLKIKGDVMKATKMEPVLKKAQTKAKL